MSQNHGIQNYGWESSQSLSDHRYTLPAIKQLLPDGQLTILDAGCGNGFIAGQLAKLGHKVTGVDLSEDGILVARVTYPNIHFEVHSVYEDFHDVVPEVDLVVSSEVIEHLFYPQLFLKNIHSILRPNGWVILTTPYHGYLKNLALSIFNAWDKHFTVKRQGGHIKFFSEKTITEMLKEVGFENVSFNNAGRVKWLWKSMVVRAQKRND